MKNKERRKKYIKIWPFDLAPEKYRRLSQNGGDEDWLALVPKWIDEKYYLSFLDTPHFGFSDVERHELKDYVVYIGCHA